LQYSEVRASSAKVEWILFGGVRQKFWMIRSL
jgi:hypothetical protein